MTFTQLFQQYLADYPIDQLQQRLERLDHPIPRRTLYRWRKGEIKKPRYWPDITAVAQALHLTELQTNDLLRAANAPAIHELLQTTTDPHQRQLLNNWNKPLQQLAPPVHFVGRTAEIEQLSQHLTNTTRLTICCLQGMPGVGKTALAAHLANELASHFSDGIIWADMRDANPMALLAIIAQTYHQDVTAYTELEDRARVIRDLLAHKQALIVLDNIQAEQNISRWLPATGASSFLLITTTPLWSIRHRAPLICKLHPFPPHTTETEQLLTKLLGSTIAQRHQTHLATIADTVGYLPLALDIIATRIQTAPEPDITIPHILAALKEETRHLDQLRLNDNISVRTSFNISYHALPTPLQQFYLALSTFRHQAFTAEAAAHVTQTSLTLTHEHLSKLQTLSLIQANNGRYHLHTLLHHYLQEKVQHRTWHKQLVNYYTNYITIHASDFNALDTIYPNIELALTYAWKYQLDSQFIKMITTLFSYWEVRGLYQTAQKQHQRAHDVAQAQNNTAALAQLYHQQGLLAVYQGHYDHAQKAYQQGIALAYQLEDSPQIITLMQSMGILMARNGRFAAATRDLNQALTLAQQQNDLTTSFSLHVNLGVIAAKQGQLAQAQIHYETAQNITQTLHHLDPNRRATLLQNLGRVHSDQGQHGQAAHYYAESLALAQQQQNKVRHSSILENQGFEAYLQGNYQQAVKYFDQSLTIAQQIENPLLISRQYLHHGLIATVQQQYDTAHQHFTIALKLAQTAGDPWDIAYTHNRWGDCYLSQDALEQASNHYRHALTLAKPIPLNEQIGRAHWGLARIAAAQQQTHQALHTGQQAYDIFKQMGFRQADEVNHWLAQQNSKTGER